MEKLADEIDSIRLTVTNYLTLVVTLAQVVETSVTTADNSPSQDFTQPDDHTTQLKLLSVIGSFR